jgi:hypothetical protein
MTLLRRSEPPAERFFRETPPANERLEAARSTLEAIGTKRRKILRLRWAMFCGTSAGFLVLFVLHLSRYWGDSSPVWLTFIPPLMQAGTLFAPNVFSASKNQKDVLATLTPLAEKSDLPWLIEGTQYADTPDFRRALLGKIQSLLDALEPEDAVYLSEGARKILRGWVGSVFRPQPETALLTLKALIRIGDAKTIQDCPKLAKRRLCFPGEEGIRRLAASTAGLSSNETPEPPVTLGETLTTIEEKIAQIRRRSRQDAVMGGLTILALIGGLVLSFNTSSALWMLPGVFIFVLAVWLGITSLISCEIRSYRYRQALLTLAALGHTAKHRKLLREGLSRIGSGQNHEALERAIDRLKGAP